MDTKWWAMVREGLFADVLYALIRRGGAKRGAGGWWTVRCPFHDDNDPSAGYNVQSGAFVCHSSRCGRRSSAAELAEVLGIATAIAPGNAKRWQDRVPYVRRWNWAQSARKVAKTPSVDYERLERVYNGLPTIREDSHGMEHARLRGLGLEVELYGVRCGDGRTIPRGALVFPYYDGGHVVGLKYRLPPQAPSALRYCSIQGSTFSVPFGVQTMKRWRLGLLVVEGEINALSCFVAFERMAQERGAWRWVDVISTGSETPSAALLWRLAELAGRRGWCVVWSDSGRVTIPGAHSIVSPTEGTTKLDANEMLRRGVLQEFLRSLPLLDDTMAERN